jgi:hypothetical protein
MVHMSIHVKTPFIFVLLVNIAYPETHWAQKEQSLPTITHWAQKEQSLPIITHWAQKEQSLPIITHWAQKEQSLACFSEQIEFSSINTKDGTWYGI